MSEHYLATHILKKDFILDEHEIYRKDTPVAIPKLHRKHEGFCCNVFFLRRNGTLRTNGWGALAWFSKSFFKPLKEWFEIIEKKDNET